MSKISIKYKSSADSGAIKALERQYKLKRESEIPVLRIYGYAGGESQMAALRKELIVEYVEKQGKMEIAGGD